MSVNLPVGICCPSCGSQESQVVDSRGNKDGSRVRRRRRCLDCPTKFTTYETTRDPLEIEKLLAQAVRVSAALRAVTERLDTAIAHA